MTGSPVHFINTRRLTCAVSVAAFTSMAAHAGPWVPLPQQPLEVLAGSALDLSRLGSVDKQGAPVSAGTHGPVRVSPQGRFVFENAPDTPVRFLAASFGFSVATGSFPDAERGRRIARQLRIAGYNLVRLHYVDGVLMDRTGAHMEFNQVQLDRLYTFLAALKNEGIYWLFDGLSDKSGGYSNSVVDKRKGQWDRSPYNVKAGVYLSDADREHYKALTRKLFTGVNPYTGSAIIDDPALAGVILVNEGGVNFTVLRSGNATLRAALTVPFNKWLKSKYVNTEALRRAWGDTGSERLDQASESIEDGTVRLPVEIHAATPRNVDAQKFIVDHEVETARWMTAHFRAPRSAGGLGYSGPVTSYNNWGSLQASLTRSHLDWVDMHNYHDDPSNFTQPGSAMRQISAIYDPERKLGPSDGPARSLGYIQAIATTRHAGKPLSVSEYGHVFWSAWRREAVAFAAYASLQDWDMICQFNEPVILPDGGSNGVPSRHRAIHTYHIGLDPIAKATETLAAFLFLRGDVAAARNAVLINVGPGTFNPPNSSMGSAGGLRYALAGTALLTKIAVNAAPPGLETVPLGRALPAGWRAPVKTFTAKGDETFAMVVSELNAAGVLPKGGLTRPSDNVYESDTREIILRAQERSLAIVTSRTEVALFETKPPKGLKILAVEKSDSPAMLALSSVDGHDLARSGRMLLTVTTDAINSDMTFRVLNADGSHSIKRGEETDYIERRVIESVGRLPVLLKSTRLTLKIANTNYSSLVVYPLALNGERKEPLPQSGATGNGVLVIEIDTAKTPTTYFEIAAQR